MDFQTEVDRSTLPAPTGKRATQAARPAGQSGGAAKATAKVAGSPPRDAAQPGNSPDPLRHTDRYRLVMPFRFDP